MIAYFYIRKNETEEALECGLKLSVYGEPIPGSGEIPINAIRAYLSPRDNMDSFQNQELVCLKLDLPAEKLLVAEKSYADSGTNEWFNKSIIHAVKYMLGTYRNPCYLITFTVLNEYISVLDKNRDVPVLYDNSAKLYLQTIKNKLSETDEGYPERALYGYMGVLVSLKEASVEWSDKKTTVFNLDGERYILKNQQMKYKILGILNENRGTIVSGQKICDELGISRTAVWKNIKSLTSEGYIIESMGGKGYLVSKEADVLNKYEIARRMDEIIPVYYFDTLDSTNNKAKQIASDIDSEISLVTSSIQTIGRGRMGRTFESDVPKGVWCSFILKPDMEPEKTLLITIAAATAVAETLNSLYGIKSGIKWPNDIIINNKKVAGILTEMNCETNSINYIVLGIGINLTQNKNDFTEQTAKIAESLYGVTGIKVLRSEMIASLCYNIKEAYGSIIKGQSEKILDLWSKYTITDGKKIIIYKNNEEVFAKAIGIDNRGMLITELEDGTISRYNSGEISIRENNKHIEREI